MIGGGSSVERRRSWRGAFPRTHLRHRHVGLRWLTSKMLRYSSLPVQAVRLPRGSVVDSSFLELGTKTGSAGAESVASVSTEAVCW